MKRLALALAAAALAAPASARAQAPIAPFGHACAAVNGVRVCPTSDLAQRVASWDGTPIDVDVTLPPGGSGPFATIVLEHGYPGTKATFQASTPKGNGGATYHYNDNFYARRGFAVVTLSARGFGRSCGVPESRTAGCEQGWTHIADQRYENRDVQHLLGLLVDEGVARPDGLGVSGVSGGGGRSVGLAYLKDRVRLPDGTLTRWVSPRGTPLHIAAAFPRWGWNDLTTALVPNGRPATSRSPLGIPKRTWIDLLYAGGAAAGFLSPPGVDPQADLTNWRSATTREPFGPEVNTIARTLTTYIGGAAGLRGEEPAPLMIENGWTDELFPADEALRIGARATRPKLLLGDLGHGWAHNPRTSDRVFNDLGAAFFRNLLQPELPRQPALPPDVQAFVSTCPKGTVGRRFSGSSLASMQRGQVVLRTSRTQRLSSRGGRAATAKALNGASGDWCTGVATRREPNTATYQAGSGGFTLLGAPAVQATIRARGAGGQIAARLWEVRGARQRLIARGLYRLRANQRGRVRFELHPNAYRFAAGRRFKLELLGRDAPYAQAPKRAFSVRVQRLRLILPTAERGTQGVSR
jgi:X-Pro dipeptidyl-peptidase (S15 family)